MAINCPATASEPAATASLPQVRVVVPCNHSESTLLACISALCRSQLDFAWEIVAVDDGGHEHDIAELLSGSPVRVERTGGKGSAAVARNLGGLSFWGEFLVFVDSDVVVEPDALARLLAPLSDGRADATVGNYSRNTTGLAFAQAYKQLYVSHIYARHAGFVRNDYWTGVCAIRTAVFRRLGGFNESMNGACGEDRELGIRLSDADYCILAVPQACGQHLHHFTLWGLIKNDLRKGLAAMRSRLHSRGPISDNRHATSTDMLAVTCSSATLLFVCLVWFAPTLASSACLATLLGYLLARRDLLHTFSRSACSLLPALTTMFTLDVVRALCVILGLGEYIVGRLLPGPTRSHPARQAVVQSDQATRDSFHNQANPSHSTSSIGVDHA